MRQTNEEAAASITGLTIQGDHELAHAVKVHQQRAAVVADT